MTMRMPQNPQMISMCMCICCPNMKRAEYALEDVKQVKRRLTRFEETARAKGYAPGRMNRSAKYAQLLHTPLHAMCGVCHEIDDAQDDIKRAERDIAGSMESIEVFMAGLKDSDPNTYKAFQRELMEIFRGVYPQVVRAIEHLR